MDNQQQFCLRWHNFQNTLLSSLPKLLDGGYLTDVTLSAGGRQIRAHKIILSACSFYFKDLFKVTISVGGSNRLRRVRVIDELNFQDFTMQQHPVIVLPGTDYADLCALVTFMYNGEVNIYQEQLPAILAMADTLHIRGLADIAGVIFFIQRYSLSGSIQPCDIQVFILRVPSLVCKGENCNDMRIEYEIEHPVKRSRLIYAL